MPRVFGSSYDLSGGETIYTGVDYSTEKSATIAVGYSNEPVLYQDSMGVIPNYELEYYDTDNYIGRNYFPFVHFILH